MIIVEAGARADLGQSAEAPADPRPGGPGRRVRAARSTGAPVARLEYAYADALLRNGKESAARQLVRLGGRVGRRRRDRCGGAARRARRHDHRLRRVRRLRRDPERPRGLRTVTLVGDAAGGDRRLRRGAVRSRRRGLSRPGGRARSRRGDRASCGTGGSGSASSPTTPPGRPMRSPSTSRELGIEARRCRRGHLGPGRGPSAVGPLRPGRRGAGRRGSRRLGRARRGRVWSGSARPTTNRSP